MKLYLALVTDSTLMEGNYEKVLGVFSTPEKAVDALKTHWNFDKAKQISEFYWKHVFDGELTTYFEVTNTELDRVLE